MLASVVTFFCGVLTVLVFALLLRYQQRLWPMLLILALALVMAYQDAQLALMSNHGLMHTSIVYELANRGAPPENPLLAGEPLYYPYGHHYLINALMPLTSLSPGWWFVLCNVITLLLLILLIDRLAALCSSDRWFRGLAVFITLVGCNPTAQGPLRQPLLWLGIPNEHRTVTLEKFLNVNSNPLGMLCFALAFLGLARLVCRRPAMPSYLMVFAGLMGAAFLYPIVWPGILGCIGLTILYLWWCNAQGHPRAALWLAGIGGLGLLLSLPWLLGLSDGKSAEAALQFWPSRWHLFRNGLVIATTVALPLILGWVFCRRLQKALASQGRLMLFLLLNALALLGLYWLVFFPLHAEYKYLIMAELPLSLILAWLLRPLAARRWLATTALLALMALPANWVLWRYAVSGFGPTADPGLSVGGQLEHREPLQRELYQWLRRQTPSDAAVVDRYLSVPAFAQRPLMVALDDRRDRGLLQGRDGWSMTAKTILEQVHGADPEILAARRHLVDALYNSPNPGQLPTVLAGLQAQLPDRPIYVLAREPSERGRLAAASGVRRVFANEAADVYLINAPAGIAWRPATEP